MGGVGVKVAAFEAEAMLDEMALETLARDEAAEEAADATDERPVAIGAAELPLPTTETEEGTTLLAEAASEEEVSALAEVAVAVLAEVVTALAEVVAALAEVVAELPL